MPPLSKQKIDKISEQILHYLFTISPDSAFTAIVAKETARDEEFIKSIMLDLEKKKLVSHITKNPKGIDYTKRKRWRLSNEAYAAYVKHQSYSSPNTVTSLTQKEYTQAQ